MPSQPADRQAQPHIYWPNMLGAVWEEWRQWESLNEGFELIYNASDEDDEEDAMGAHNNATIEPDAAWWFCFCCC